MSGVPGDPGLPPDETRAAETRAAEMDEVLSRRWPQTRVPEYPALAGPDAVLAQVPDWWQPEG